jgi:hypothetical protein
MRINLTGIEILELQIHCKGSNSYGLAGWLDPKVTR